jgi:hypothetical protein
MARIAWISVVLLAAGRAAAQEPELPVKKMTVSPAAAPVPALKYELLPELKDTTPGNAALLYYRAFSPEWVQATRNDKQLQEKVNEALDKPAAEVKAMPEVQIVRNWQMLKEVDRAARRSYCDWEMTPRVREEGISMLLPDVQSFREYARYLKIRTKLELADREFGQAIYTLQTGMKLGRDIANAPTLIQALVGAAVTAINLSEVEEWIGTPDSPNLYWALGLPQPYIDLRKPLQGERIFLDNLLPGYREALADPSKVPPPIGVADVLGKVEGRQDLGDKFLIAAVIAAKYPAAKAFLIAHGRTSEQVDALPAQTAVLLQQVATYDRFFDEMLKWEGQPYWIAKPGLDRSEVELKQELTRAGGPGLSLAGLLLPAISKVHYASARTDRKINLLRTIEALRMYAAAHGRWPEALADITDVPVPTDPVTGKPFEYRRDGEKAVLTAGPPAGEKAHQGNSERYEITLAAKR